MHSHGQREKSIPSALAGANVDRKRSYSWFRTRMTDFSPKGQRLGKRGLTGMSGARKHSCSALRLSAYRTAPLKSFGGFLAPATLSHSSERTAAARSLPDSQFSAVRFFAWHCSLWLHHSTIPLPHYSINPPSAFSLCGYRHAGRLAPGLGRPLGPIGTGEEPRNSPSTAFPHPSSTSSVIGPDRPVASELHLQPSGALLPGRPKPP